MRITDEGDIKSLNIGDSGYNLWRYNPAASLPITESVHSSNLEMLYQTIAGQKQFNFPD